MRTDVIKPTEFKITALIFFGRARYVDLLDCYMQQNMVYNDGYLDEVHFMAHTQSALDLQWLDGLLEARPGYKKVTFPAECNEFLIFGCLYQAATANDTLYIKLDDDIVSMISEQKSEQDCYGTLLTTTLSYFVSKANSHIVLHRKRRRPQAIRSSTEQSPSLRHIRKCRRFTTHRLHPQQPRRSQTLPSRDQPTPTALPPHPGVPPRYLSGLETPPPTLT